MQQAREEGLSQWEDVLKGQAKEASEGTSTLEADRLSQEVIFQERSEAVEAEERRVEEARLGLEEREKALVGREAELAELEAGREERAAELERVRDRLSLLEKGVEGQRADLARRKVKPPYESCRVVVCNRSRVCTRVDFLSSRINYTKYFVEVLGLCL